MSENPSAESYISEIKRKLKRTNRFSIDEEFNTSLLKCFAEKKKLIEKGRILYRARIYSEDDRYEKYGELKKGTWEGYDEDNSFVNKKDDWNAPGRMNPAGIKYLYTATTIDTCLAEVKPYAKTLVSVTEIRINRDLNIVDFSEQMGAQNSSGMAVFSLSIDRELSRGDIGVGDYIFTQYIAEFCKVKSFDGMVYSSSFDENSGENIVVFNYDKYEAISSKLYFIDKIKIKNHLVISK